MVESGFGCNGEVAVLLQRERVVLEERLWEGEEMDVGGGC